MLIVTDLTVNLVIQQFDKFEKTTGLISSTNQVKIADLHLCSVFYTSAQTTHETEDQRSYIIKLERLNLFKSEAALQSGALSVVLNLAVK